MRIIIADDEPLMRQGLRLLLDGAEGITVVGEASNGREAVSLIATERPDVALMDIRMPIMDGIEAVKLVPDTPVIMLTAFDTEQFVLDAMRAGAVGFLLKTTPPKALVNAIISAGQGQQVLSPGIVDKLLQREDEWVKNPLLETLTVRESEVAELVAQGLSNAEIAQSLFITPTTVKTHIKNVLEKIQGTNRVHIVIAILEAKRSR